MNDLGSRIPTLSAAQRIVLAIDTSDKAEADDLAELARSVGARFIKIGLQLSSATSWQWCSELAKKHGLDWIADAKLNDIPSTVESAVANLVALQHRPFAITMHATAGSEAMTRAQNKAGDVKVLGVTVLTSLSDQECLDIYGGDVKIKVMKLALSAAEAGLAGIVASPQEVGMIKQNSTTKHMLSMIPSARSKDVQHADQTRVATPAESIRAGADLLVIGREITKSGNPAAAYAKVVKDIQAALND